MSTEEGRWLEGLDERTERERMTAAHDPAAGAGLDCDECGHPLDQHGASGCMDSDHPDERDNLGFCVCQRPLADLLPSVLNNVWFAGYVYGHRQACPGRCTHGLPRNPYGGMR